MTTLKKKKDYRNWPIDNRDVGKSRKELLNNYYKYTKGVKGKD